MIDQEWLNASGGKFGFSVQLAIYKQTGNTPGSYSDETWFAFGEAVGWKKFQNWIGYDNLAWGTNAPAIAPKGHLPGLGWWLGENSIRGFSLLTVACKL
jgi:hypothetical protein